jgi:hypothetical protein
MTGWLLLLGGAIAAAALVAYQYGRRETPGRGRGVLATLRWGALMVLLLLVLNPELPALGAGAGRATQLLVDGSLSMALPAAPGDARTRWEVAAEEAVRHARGRRVLVFGDAPRPVLADSLPALAPTAAASRLLPALQAAAEAGARRALVLTDGAIADAAEVERWLPRLGLEVEFRHVAAGEVANVAVAEVEAPAWGEAGRPLEVRIGIAARGAAGDSATVAILRDGQEVARGRVALPQAGRIAPATLTFSPAEGPRPAEPVRFDVVVEPAGALTADARRSFYVQVGERPAGIVLLAFGADWEPRFLLPVLEQALGLPARGYVRAGERYARIGAPGDAGRPADEAEARQAAGRADLLVVQGLAAAPAWARELAARAPRLLLLPGAATAQATQAAATSLPLELPPPAAGEWYVTDAVPPSPVAQLLAGIAPAALPPLTGVRPVLPQAGAWTALTAQRARRGEAVPVLVGGTTAGRRWAVALGEGYWQWALRGGESREAYRRLWGGVGGWLGGVARGPAAAAPVRVVARVNAPGRPLAWIAPGLAADSLAVRLEDAAGDVVADTVLAPARGDTVTLAPPAPGHYTFQARAFAGDTVAGAGSGALTVESYSPEYLRPPAELAGLAAAAAAAQAASGGMTLAGAGRGEPLRLRIWPYLLVALLLCTEWALRRRWGLR